MCLLAVAPLTGMVASSALQLRNAANGTMVHCAVGLLVQLQI